MYRLRGYTQADYKSRVITNSLPKQNELCMIYGRIKYNTLRRVGVPSFLVLGITVAKRDETLHAPPYIHMRYLSCGRANVCGVCVLGSQ